MDELKQPLEELKSQLKGLTAELKEVSHDIREAKFSEYPIFVAHQENARIGELLFDRAEYGFPYSINATTIERLLELNIIQEDRLQEFKKAYGDAQKNYCVLWLKGEFTRFVFMPF
jgi:hypothetical protein